MTKPISLGDLNVNEDVNERISGSFKKVEKSTEEIKVNPEIQNAIPIQRNEDGSLKYTFDNIYKNEQLASVAKEYYKNRDKQVYDDKEAVDKFISDRTWKQANTLAMGKEFAYVTGKNFVFLDLLLFLL